MKKEELFFLIKSLSRSEKRNFKLESGHHKELPNYVRLFDVIDAQDEYDEEDVRKHFEGEKLNDQFHVLKNYLKQAILKSLRNFHGSSSKAVELRNCIVNIEILFNKELYRHCEVEIRKAERIAIQCQLYHGLMEVLAWKRRLAQTRDPSDFKSFSQILDQQEEAYQKIGNQQEYNRLILEISESIYQGELKPVRHEEYLEDAKNAQTFESGVMHFNARYFRCIQGANGDQAPEILRSLESFFEANQELLAQYPGLYLSSMNNAIGYFVYNQRYNEALEMLERMKAFRQSFRLKNENLTLLKQVLRTRLIELDVYRSLDIVEERKVELNEIIALVGKNEGKMPKDYLISFWFQLANVEFFRKEYSNALKWLNNILNYKFGEIRLDIQVHARMLNMMAHFEQENMFVLRYFVDSTRRFVRKKELDQGLIPLLIHLFSDLGKAPVLEYKAIIQGFVRQLDERASDQGMHGQLRWYVDYERWFKAYR